MKYWFLCLPREDMNHCIKEGVFGLSRKNVISKVKEGDKVVCCAGKGDWKIIGLGSATSDYYVDDKMIFLKEGHFPDRFDFSVKRLPNKKEIDVKSLLNQLSFVKDLEYWSVFFRNGIAQMSKQDWEFITTQ